MKRKDRVVYTLDLCVKETTDAAIVAFLLRQVLDDTQWILVSDATSAEPYQFGIVCVGDKEVEKVKKVLTVLDDQEIYYVSSALPDEEE